MATLIFCIGHPGMPMQRMTPPGRMPGPMNQEFNVSSTLQCHLWLFLTPDGSSCWCFVSELWGHERPSSLQCGSRRTWWYASHVNVSLLPSFSMLPSPDYYIVDIYALQAWRSKSTVASKFSRGECFPVKMIKSPQYPCLRNCSLYSLPDELFITFTRPIQCKLSHPH